MILNENLEFLCELDVVMACELSYGDGYDGFKFYHFEKEPILIKNKAG
jgi:hypothetical protein